MSSRRHLLPVVIVILGLASLRPAAADPADDGAKFIDDFGHRAIAVYRGEILPTKKREGQQPAAGPSSAF